MRNCKHSKVSFVNSQKAFTLSGVAFAVVCGAKIWVKKHSKTV